ncbi:hypothetical protein GQ44DRAFT_697809 [Phaeosphaeriaceae sp. PMI808]|nr:hypothetical protein GQ44DRAFT_697809 [Phaeosphaeriaceae sp. PMI808]
MSTAHICFRSVLTQAFRPSNRGIATSCSVASFLVPALAPPLKCSFSTGKRRSKEQSRPLHSSAYNATAAKEFPSKPSRGLPELDIPLPHGEARGDIQQWLTVIEPFLPGHLRRAPPEIEEPLTLTPIDLARIINAAQDASVDILTYLGLVEGRWQVVTWMAKKLVEDGQHFARKPVQSDEASIINMAGFESEPQSLKNLTESPIRVERVRPLRKADISLEDMTSLPHSIDLRHIVVKRALGQLWQSLGSMILAGAERTEGEDVVMSHVLEIIAYLHHVGLMPDSVYTYRAHENKYALQQPPTLHMLSSKILTALSDASWKAHEESVKLTKDRVKVSYFLGHEIPGSRYKLHVTGVAPELWLELVLWSCLHGGWIKDGIAILKRLASKQQEHPWSLISWREILEAERLSTPAPSKLMRLFSRTETADASAEDRARTRKTISSEVVTAFVDAVVNDVRLGVGSRGSDPEDIVKHLKALKDFLDSNNLSLGSTAWDSIMARLLESGAFVPEKRPKLLLRLFELAPTFGTEVGTANTSATCHAEVPYFFEPTTLPLNLLHRTMRAFIDIGDMKGAMSTLTLLHQHTDKNKEKSAQQFFEVLKSEPPRDDGLFNSRLPPVDFPAFEINMPVPLLAKLLDLATDSKMYDLGRWFLFAQDLDGPLIGRDIYDHRNIAASIVRFGTLSGENNIVLDIVRKAGTWNAKHQQQRMPAEVFIALFCSQLKLRRWESVRSMQQYVVNMSTFRPRPIILSVFAAELLRTVGGAEEERLKAQNAFTELLFAWEALIMTNVRNELYCILAIMSSVNRIWKKYCSQFLATSLRQSIMLSTTDFNHILLGILDVSSSSKGKIIVETWCYISNKDLKAYRAPGGLLRMPRLQLGSGENYENRPEAIELVQESGAKLILQGRIYPNRQTIWSIVQKVQEELDQRQRQADELTATHRAKARKTLRWAVKILHHLGYEYEDIIHDLGSSLTELAELETLVAPEHVEKIDGAHGHIEFG